VDYWKDYGVVLMREKLIELLADSEYLSYEAKADHLIANGVVISKKETVATDNNKWIPVTERLPTPYIPVLVCKQHLGGQQQFIIVDHIVIGYGETKIWMGDIGTWKNEVTHWMPLPQPPKGE
jgi:hypothetical protein